MKNAKTKIGFLPLFIKLYDDCGAGAKSRPRLEPFAKKLAGMLEERGFETVVSPFCRVKEEFAAAVECFEKAGCEAIVTWHAAYSPSLESIDALAGTELPIIVLDTTETYDFGPCQDPGEISYCHGIHGVMDMCSMLRRRGKKFAIAAGYVGDEVIDRVAGFVHAAVAARSMKGMKTGTVGGSFEGMGDFLVSDEEMKSRFGVEIVYPEKGELASYAEDVKDDEIARETAADFAAFDVLEPFGEESHARTVRYSLAVRRWIEKRGLSAFTVNFLEVRPENGLKIMPFMEACKEMAAGVGYAGEGDVLTASLVGALMNGFADTTFVEIFCPDWRGNTLLLSHMGEFNIRLASGRPAMKEIPFIYGDADDPVVAYGRYRGGEGVFINLYRSAEGFKVLLSETEMVDIPDSEDKFKNKVRGWMRPRIPVARFLEELSRHGATHHSAFVYGADAAQIGFFCDLLGLGYDVI